MEQSVSRIIKQLIAMIWRRRFLAFVPLLVMLPLSILGTKVMPKQYMTSALMVLPESDRDNPFIKNSSLDYSLAKRIEGLDSWLKSDHVLGRIQHQFTKTDREANPAAFLQEVQDLREAITLSLVGNDFLKFTLKGGSPKGMGVKLEAIMARFLEGLLLPDDSVASAGQFVLRVHRSKLKTIQKKRKLAVLEYQKLLSKGNNRQENAHVIALQSRLIKIQKDHAGTVKTIKAVHQLEASGKSDGSQIAGKGKSLDQSPGDPGLNLHSAAMSKHLQALKTKKDLLAREMTQIITTLKSSGEGARKLYAMQKKIQELKLTELRANNALKRSSQFLDNANVHNPLGILNAPEGIKMIDTPADPLRATTSNLTFVLIGLFAAIFLGIGLATMAELIDPRLRTKEEIATIAGAPILGHLPRF